MINLFNIAKNNNLLSIKNLKYLSVPFYLQNSIIGMENNNSINNKNNIENIINNKNNIENLLINTDIKKEDFEIFIKNIKILEKDKDDKNIIRGIFLNNKENEKDKININNKKNEENKININIEENEKNIEEYNFEEIKSYIEKIKNNVEYKIFYNIFSKFEIGKCIHNGSLSIIHQYSIIKKDENNKQIKVYYCCKFIPENTYKYEIIPYTLKENLKDKSTIGYKNIVDIYRCINNKFFNCIFTPSYFSRDLDILLRYNDMHKCITNKLIFTFCIFRQIIDGYNILYKNKIFHSDLKPDNIFIDKSFNLKIADFSVSRKYYDNFNYNLNANGTKIYVSPESLSSKTISTKDLNKVDMYGFGCILYRSFYGKNFMEIEKLDTKEDIIKKIENKYKTMKQINSKLIEKITRNLLNGKNVSNEEFANYKVGNLILNLLNPDIDKRMSFENVKKSSFYEKTNILYEKHLEWLKIIDNTNSTNSINNTNLDANDKIFYPRYIEKSKINIEENGQQKEVSFSEYFEKEIACAEI